MKTYNCTNCYDTDNIVLSRALLADVLCALVQREYDADRYNVFMESCGYTEEDALAYKQVAADTHAQINKLEARIPIVLDRSFISDSAPVMDTD